MLLTVSASTEYRLPSARKSQERWPWGRPPHRRHREAVGQGGGGLGLHGLPGLERRRQARAEVRLHPQHLIDWSIGVKRTEESRRERRRSSTREPNRGRSEPKPMEAWHEKARDAIAANAQRRRARASYPSGKGCGPTGPPHPEPVRQQNQTHHQTHHQTQGKGTTTLFAVHLPRSPRPICVLPAPTAFPNIVLWLRSGKRKRNVSSPVPPTHTLIAFDSLFTLTSGCKVFVARAIPAISPAPPTGTTM